MIKEKTVFILGAGANKPYGFPTGNELREQICRNSYKNIVSKIPKNDRGYISEYYKEEVQDKLESFTSIFFKSSTPSIDLFLSRNIVYADIGKLSIIVEILEAEKDSKFREDMVVKDQDWYSYLFHFMTKEIVTNENYKDFSSNNVSFITFNYDRSLEFFLHESFINSFNGEIDKKSLNDEFNKIYFAHVFGIVAPLPLYDEMPKDTTLEYRAKYTIDKAMFLRRNIKLIHEGTQQDISEIKSKIREANRIFFLGFGFANENLEILELPKILNNSQKIYGTVLGKSEREIINIHKKFRPPLPDSNLNFEKTNCLDLLRNHL